MGQRRTRDDDASTLDPAARARRACAATRGKRSRSRWSATATGPARRWIATRSPGSIVAIESPRARRRARPTTPRRCSARRGPRTRTATSTPAATTSQIQVEHLLATGDRGLAARALTFDAACAWGALARSDAKTAAHRLASLGLELPDATVSPDVEAMIGDTIAQLGKQPHHALAVSGATGGRLSVDGRPAGCALPCTVDFPPAITCSPSNRWLRARGPHRAYARRRRGHARPGAGIARARGAAVARADRPRPAGDRSGRHRLARAAGE